MIQQSEIHWSLRSRAPNTRPLFTDSLFQTANFNVVWRLFQVNETITSGFLAIVTRTHTWHRQEMQRVGKSHVVYAHAHTLEGTREEEVKVPESMALLQASEVPPRPGEVTVGEVECKFLVRDVDEEPQFAAALAVSYPTSMHRMNILRI